MDAGALIHRITVMRYTVTVDPVTGYRTEAWADAFPDVTAQGGFPAAYKAGPGREYLASEALRAEVQGRFILRWSPDARSIKAADRILWDGLVWQVKSPPMVDPSARKEITLMVSEGLLDG